MRRRSALRGSIWAATALGLAGCLGYELSSSEDVERRERRIETLSRS